MGLPTINFRLEKAAQTVAARISQGNVALIVRDANATGVYAIYQESDIPAALSASNIAYIKRALIGYINRPAVVYVAVIASNATIDKGFNALKTYSYDYLAGPSNISSADATALANMVIESRELRYIGKGVLPNTASDNEAIINFVAAGIKSGATAFTTAEYCSRIGGILAGTPADCSATYAQLPELTAVDAIEDPDAAVDAGKFILIDDGRRIKTGRAVTSKVTLADNEPKGLKKIKMTAAIDLIRYYAVTTIEDEYQGKCANSYDNKCVLLTAIRGYLQTLEANDVLRRGSSSVALDPAATRAFLVTADPDNAAKYKAMADAQIIKQDTGSHVFLRLTGYVLDAMEDFDIGLLVGNTI